jgi:hypothetical protein
MNQFWGNESNDVDKPKWSPVCVSPKGVKVTWVEKYGETKIEICIGLWETTDEYMLTYRDRGGYIIQKSNCDDLKYSINE